MGGLISVVIPTYNASKYIQSAIESVLDQTYKNYEIIVVDDCSKDNTTEQLQKYKDIIYVVRHEKNQGAAVARNTGVGLCRGELVAFLDGDDKWAPEKLQVFAESFSRNPDVLFGFSDFSRFEWSDGSFFAQSNSQVNPMIYELIRDHKYFDLKAFVIPRTDLFPLLLRGYPIYPSAIVVRKKLFDLIGVWRKIRTNEDFDFGLRSCRVTDCMYIDERLAMVGRHDANLTVDVQQQIEGDISVIDLHLSDPTYKEEELKLITHYKGRRLCGLGYNYLHSGDNEKAIGKYREALKYRDFFWHALVRILYIKTMANRGKRNVKVVGR